MNPIYPFSAVVCQEQLKLSLVLNAIDPAIGGVLVQGQRGVAKTTLARALGELTEGQFVELPLGASEERVTGTLDLHAALRDGRVEFSPGLLARAHQGVLYVDEVNLLPDALVDVLLDAAGSGRNTVERDGVSHVHAARFVLIGTMNPEEGELRPQLTDRFGLSVVAEGELTPALRTEIVLRRLDFERDPAAFRARFAGEQAQLLERCKRARARVETIALAGAGLELVAEHCYAAGVEGVRADLAMLRAARAHAAWQGRDAILADDVHAVAELALAHRRGKGGASGNGGGGGGGGAKASSSASASSTASAAPKAPSRTSARDLEANSASRSGNDGGQAATDVAGAAKPSSASSALNAVPVRAMAVAHAPAWAALTRTTAELRRKGARKLSARRGARMQQAAGDGAIDWFATLARHRQPRLDQLCYRARKTPEKQLWVLAIDCSMSMLRGGGLASAKGLAQAMQGRAMRAGAHVALISFGGASAQLAVPAQAARGSVERALEQLSAGGGTPLRDALEQALALCTQRNFQSPRVMKRILLATDGRTRQSVADLQPASSDVEIVVVDCERTPLKLGRAALLAQQLGARCLHIDALS